MIASIYRWRSSLFVLIALFVIVLLVDTMSTNSAEQRSPKVVKISWSPRSIDEELDAGSTHTFSLTFVPTEDASNASLRIVPELKPFVTTEPALFKNLRANEAIHVDMTIHSSSLDLPQQVSGTLQLRNSDANESAFANPLPITLNIKWKQFLGSSGISFSYPPGYVPSVSGGLRIKEVGFSENQQAYNSGIAPTFTTTLQALPTGKTVRDWVHGFGVTDERIREVSIAGRTFLQWSENLGEGDGQTVSYSVQTADNHVFTFNIYSQEFAASPALTEILTSLTFTTL